MVSDPKRSDMNYISAGGGDDAGGGGLDVQGLPLVKPPWGRITAIDLEQGRDRLAGRARRDAGRGEESPRAARG